MSPRGLAWFEGSSLGGVPVLRICFVVWKTGDSGRAAQDWLNKVRQPAREVKVGDRIVFGPRLRQDRARCPELRRLLRERQQIHGQGRRVAQPLRSQRPERQGRAIRHRCVRRHCHQCTSAARPSSRCGRKPRLTRQLSPRPERSGRKDRGQIRRSAFERRAETYPGDVRQYPCSA